MSISNIQNKYIRRIVLVLLVLPISVAAVLYAIVVAVGNVMGDIVVTTIACWKVSTRPRPKKIWTKGK
jgi:hypothetical protein